MGLERDESRFRAYNLVILVAPRLSGGIHTRDLRRFKPALLLDVT